MKKQIITTLSIILAVVFLILMGIIIFNNTDNNQTSKPFIKNDLSEKKRKDSLYLKDKNAVYYFYSPGEKSILQNADPATFKELNENWAKDNNNVFNYGKLIEGVDITSFQVIEGSVYAKDKNKIYFPDYIDKNNLKFDPETFEILNDIYIKDMNQVACIYMAGGAYGIYKLLWADSQSFQTIGDSFGKDSNHVYYKERHITDANSETFRLLDDSFGVDKNFVYWKDNKLKADLKTFKPNEHNRAQDKNNIYSCYEDVVCGYRCHIVNLKTQKEHTDYFGFTPTETICK